MWRGSPVTASPERKGICLAYDPGSIEKILMSLSVDLTSSGSFLNPAAPLRVNDKDMQIEGLTASTDQAFLSKVEKNDIPVTDLLKIDPGGTKNADNMISVNYVDRRKQKSKPAGTLSLYLTVVEQDIVKEVSKPVTGPKTKFCMYEGKNIPDDAVFCCYCGLEQPRGGAAPKECRNCQALLPPVAVYCKECGNKQPDVASEPQPEPQPEPEGSPTEMS
jgi:hypothetical protein